MLHRAAWRRAVRALRPAPYHTRAKYIPMYSPPTVAAGERRVEIASEPRPAAASTYTTYLPLSSDEVLRAAYQSAFAGLRLGRLLEDLDAVAGDVAYRHADLDPPGAGDDLQKFFLATASVDRIAVRCRCPSSPSPSSPSS